MVGQQIRLELYSRSARYLSTARSYPGDRLPVRPPAGAPDRYGHRRTDRLAAIEPLFAPGQLEQLQREVATTTVIPALHDSLVRLAAATRSHRDIHLGLSPRGLLVWQRCAQAATFVEHRRFVTPADVLNVAVPILSVRLGLDAEHQEPVLQQIVDSVPVPEGLT